MRNDIDIYISNGGAKIVLILFISKMLLIKNGLVVLSGKRPNGFLTLDPDNEFYAHYTRFLYNYDTLVEGCSFFRNIASL